MSATLSMDLRERIVSAYLDGEGSYDTLAERFEVSPSVVGKLVRQWRSEGSLKPHTDRRGRKRAISGATEEALREHLRQHPDATLQERREALGLSCSVKTVWMAVRRLRARFKKSRSVRPSRTARTSPEHVATGSPRKNRSTPIGLSSSTKRVSKRI